MKVYLVVNDWATEDANDVSITVFDSFEKAKDELLKQRAEEINECWQFVFTNQNTIFIKNCITYKRK